MGEITQVITHGYNSIILYLSCDMPRVRLRVSSTQVPVMCQILLCTFVSRNATARRIAALGHALRKTKDTWLKLC